MTNIKLRMRVEGHDGTGHSQAAQVTLDGTGAVAFYYPAAVEHAAQAFADGADEAIVKTEHATITLSRSPACPGWD